MPRGGELEEFLLSEIEDLSNTERDFVILPDGTYEWRIDGVLQASREGPSKVLPDGTREWHVDGVLQSIDDMPSRILPDGTREWHEAGELGRDHDLPAKIWSDGSREWYMNNLLHREGDLPARIMSSGLIEYRIKGELHRDGAPALICVTQEARDKSDGIIVAYFQNNLCINPDEGPCVIKESTKDDPAKLGFYEGYDEILCLHYYYYANKNGIEELWSQAGDLLNTTNGRGAFDIDSPIIDDIYHAGVNLSDHMDALFEKARAKSRRLRFPAEPELRDL